MIIMESSYIYHITTAAAWEKAQLEGAYIADSLATEGFILPIRLLVFWTVITRVKRV
jgi:hypothetical protein